MPALSTYVGVGRRRLILLLLCAERYRRGEMK